MNEPGSIPGMGAFFFLFYIRSLQSHHTRGVPCPPRITGGRVETLVGYMLKVGYNHRVFYSVVSKLHIKSS